MLSSMKEDCGSGRNLLHPVVCEPTHTVFWSCMRSQSSRNILGLRRATHKQAAKLSHAIMSELFIILNISPQRQKQPQSH